QLSVDDVPASAHAAAGRSGVVTQSLGGLTRFREIAPHLCRQSLAPRSYLLCSDGLYDGLDLETMESAIDDDMGASVSRLFDRAMAAGARDNISIILLRVHSQP
ncbi:MAG: serine/threonine-protein phosphatase, partial [Pseudomonadota bacterium]